MKKTQKSIVNDHENYMSLHESFSKNDQLPFVIDGQNFVFSLNRKFQKDGLINLIDQLSAINHPNYLILPGFLINRYKLNKDFLEEKNTSLIRIDNHSKDDWGILGLAEQYNGLIISNDQFRQFTPYYPKELFSRLIDFVTFSINGKIFIKIPFVEFIKLQNKNQNDITSENHENTTSPGFEVLSS